MINTIVNQGGYFELNLPMLFTFIASYLFIYRKLGGTRYPETKKVGLSCRIVSCIHAFLSCYGSYMYLTEQIDYIEWSNKYIMISRMYVLYDIVMILLNFNLNELLHHIVFYIGMLANDEEISWLVALGLFAEMTNFNLYFGWFLLSLGYNNTIAFKINALMLLVVYFVTRVINYGYLSYAIFNIYGFEFRFLMLPALWVLNIHWFKTLVNKAINMYKL